MVSAMNEVEQEFGVKITFSIEDEPLGTGVLLLIISWSIIIGKGCVGFG
jgi:NDP-sugar pyrophosphorylase family protein